MDDSVSPCRVDLPRNLLFLTDTLLEKYIKKLTGNSDIEDSLDRLDKLTVEETRMASAELLKITHSVEENVQGVRGNVQDVGNKVQSVDDRVQGISNDVREVNRSLSLSHLLIVPRTQAASQGTTSRIVSYDGFRPQIHPSIITLHPKLVTTVLLNGSFKAVYSISGRLPTPSCGYTENVCYSC